MKKIFIVMAFIFLIQIVNVKADDLMIDYNVNNGKYELKLSSNDKEISYEEAIEQYQIDEYFQFAIGDTMHYFYLGKEISLEEFNSGVKLNEKRKQCDEKMDFCIEITSQEELINKIDDIYDSRKIGMYHLLYNSSTYKSINFNEVNKYYKEKYMTDIKKNAFKYSEYGLMNPIFSLPTYDDTEMIISTLTVKTTPEEEVLVEKFLDVFMNEFEGVSDYEKVLGVYSYLSKTSTYASEDTDISVFLEGKLSPYDVLLTHQHVCIGVSTTFQFLMEKLGIESYIIENIEIKNGNERSTTHVYNVVKLDDKWFVVDVTSANNRDSLLITSESYDDNDFKYLGIKISDKAYSEMHPDASKSFNIDYDKYLKLADELVNGENDEKQEEKETSEDNISTKKDTFDYKYLLIIVGIVAAICSVILTLTKVCINKKG